MTPFHLVALPHTLLTREYDHCAYTAKIRRFVDMLAMAGREVIVYGPDIHECENATEYVSIVDETDRRKWFGVSEWNRDQVFDRWEPTDECWVTMNQRAAEAIRQRSDSDVTVGIIAGLCQRSIIDQLADRKPLVIEWGIGYSGVLPDSHKVFESHAWAHHVAGFYRKDDIAFFDDVIPNCFDPADYTFDERSGDYLLYMGRPTARKGLPIVAELAKRVDFPIKIAGQPGADIPGTEYVGLVTGTEKAELLAGARALLCPTMYLEPFGGVAVEAMMSGTPVISTDWGAFTETVITGQTGLRCRMLYEFIEAVEDIDMIDRQQVRLHAIEQFSLSTGKRLYDDYLKRVETLYGEGWYSSRPR